MTEQLSILSRPAAPSPAPQTRVQNACCPFCSGNHARIVVQKNPESEWKIAECVDCGQWFTTPIPNFSNWEEYYPHDYSPYRVRERKSHGLWRKLHGYVRQHGMRLRREPSSAGVPSWGISGLTRFLRPRRPYYHLPRGTGKLLDVGCASGTYLARMRDLGWQVMGLDKSDLAAERARATYGLDVEVGELNACTQLPGAPFDLITAWQVLEHVENPRRALANLRELLAPNTGRLLLTVPNLESWGARIFSSDWIAWDLPRHLTHFSQTTLCRMLAAERFEVVYVRTIGHSSWLRHSARNLPSGSWRRLFCSKAISRITSAAAVRAGQGESLFVIARRAEDKSLGR